MLNNHSRDRFDRSILISLLLLLLWVAIGLILRLTNLTLKPASSIEIATIGYSLGHGFNQIPVERVISMETLLAPLRLDTAIGYIEVFNRLAQESTHPPLYFWLTHLWLNLWLKPGDLASLEVARSLSTVFGVLGIPASFALGWVTFRSRLVAHLTAVLMAISPYGIYLAQEARHYTLTVLWVIASLTCLVKAIKLIEQKVTVPIWLSLAWILVNALGIATHYFFILALGAEAIAFVVFWLFNRQGQPLRYLRGLYLAGIGTVGSILVWLPIIDGISNNQLTTWIETSYQLNEIWLPLPRLLAWVITMVMLLPVEGTPQAVTIGSGLIVVAVLIWMMPTFVRQWRSHLLDRQTRSSMIIISSYLLGSLIVFLIVIYALEKDISLAARYHFVYFPGIILLVAVALAGSWEVVSNQSIWRKFSVDLSTKVIVVCLTMGLFGSLTVINNFGFQKSRQSDRLAAHIQQNSTLPTIVAMTHETHSEIREITALAVSFQRLKQDQELVELPQFILVDHNQSQVDLTASGLAKYLRTDPQPVNLFGVNLDLSDSDLKQLGCKRNKAVDLIESGYRDRFYLCP